MYVKIYPIKKDGIDYVGQLTSYEKDVMCIEKELMGKVQIQMGKTWVEVEEPVDFLHLGFIYGKMDDNYHGKMSKGMKLKVEKSE